MLLNPSVDIFLPVCGEPLPVLGNTWKGVKEIQYKGQVSVWVLDDADCLKTKLLASLFGFNYRVREDRPSLKKAGNLRSAFKVTTGDFILILDADFRPHPDILNHLVPYLIDHPRVPIVQTPQYFEILPEQTYIQKGAAYVQELYYRLLQVVRNNYGAANCVGSCALYRRAALNDLGGTAPKHHSEDLWTGVLVQIAGWDPVEYLPLALTKGLCPDTIKAFYYQQYRWCAGTLSLIFSRDFWFDFKVNELKRYFYIQGFLYYFVTAFLLLVYPMLGFYIGYFYPEGLLQYLIFTYLSKLITETGFLATWTRAPFGLYYFQARYVAYISHLVAFWDKMFNTPMPWVPTGAVSTTKKSGYNRFILLAIGMPTIWLIVAIGLSLIPTQNKLVEYARYALVLQQIIAILVTVYPIVDEEFKLLQIRHSLASAYHRFRDFVTQ